MRKYRVLILGASYGSLLAIKLLLAGHKTRLVCLPNEVEAINADGIRVRMPVKGREGLLEVDSRRAPGELSASGPAEVNPADYDLVALAMAEPQYRAPGVRELLASIAKARVPCMSIMNMPPLPYLARIPGLNAQALRDCYTDPTVWDGFDPDLVTLCSPDPQAFRPPDEKINVLQVSLPTNFKVARFPSDAHTRILRDLEADICAVRYEGMELPVKLRVHESVFVPLAKWSMLLTGNYRCVQTGEVRSIRDAVHTDLAQSREVYDWVSALCRRMGAAPDDQVPFEKYAAAASGLAKPSAAARALAAGAPNIERVDSLVQRLAAERGMHLDTVDTVVAAVNRRLAENRRPK